MLSKQGEGEREREGELGGGGVRERERRGEKSCHILTLWEGSHPPDQLWKERARRCHCLSGCGSEEPGSRSPPVNKHNRVALGPNSIDLSPQTQAHDAACWCELMLQGTLVWQRLLVYFTSPPLQPEACGPTVYKRQTNNKQSMSLCLTNSQFLVFFLSLEILLPHGFIMPYWSLHFNVELID